MTCTVDVHLVLESEMSLSEFTNSLNKSSENVQLEIVEICHFKKNCWTKILYTNHSGWSLQELGLLFPVPPGGHLQGPLPEDGGVGGVGHFLLPGSPTPGPATSGLPDLPSGRRGTGAHNGHRKRWAVEDLYNL